MTSNDVSGIPLALSSDAIRLEDGKKKKTLPIPCPPMASDSFISSLYLKLWKHNLRIFYVHFVNVIIPLFPRDYRDANLKNPTYS